MLNRLTALITDIAHQSPTAIRIASCHGELRRNGVHARKERRVLRRVAQIRSGTNMFARNDQQMSGACGAMSSKAMTRSEAWCCVLGSSPAMMRQKRQSAMRQF